MVTNIQKLSGAISGFHGCVKSGCKEWMQKHKDTIREMENNLPHGSGIDGDNTIEIDECTKDKIVIYTSFHHMSESGMYDGWTEHKITVTPAFIGLNMKISGKDRNQIKEYLGDIFYDFLTEEIE